MPKLGHVLIGGDGKLLSVDTEFCEIMRSSSEHLIGRTVREVTAPADRIECEMAIARLLRSGQSFEITKRFLRQDGSLFWSKNSVSLLNDSRSTTIVATIDPVRLKGDRHPAALLAAARNLIIARNERASVCDPDLFSEPGWDAILATYVAEAEGCSIDAPTLAVLLGISLAATQRWISVLILRAVLEIEYRNPRADAAKAYRLTAATQRKLEDYLSQHFSLLVDV